MPGGSVNGRPFRESSDSYARTGIPCGNPRRYRSHEVVRMEPAVRSRSKPIDGPVENIETEGQKQLQALLKRQMETKVTIKQQLGQKREFSRGSEFQASTDDLEGTRSLNDFRLFGDVDAYIEEMKSYGLTHEEILFKMQAENEEAKVKKGKLSNTDFEDARLREINDKIAKKKQFLAEPDKFSNIQPITRHEMELENAIANANSHNKFLHQTLVKERQHASITFPNDPMNHLPVILDNITKNSSSCSRLKHCKKKDKSYMKQCTLECCVPVSTVSCSKCESEAEKYQNEATSSCDHCSRSCDQTKMVVQTCAERPADYVSQSSELQGKAKQEKKKPEKSTLFSVRTKTETPVVSSTTVGSELLENVSEENRNSEGLNSSKKDEEIRILDHVEGIPEDAIRQYKLSAEDITRIPKFESYTPGKPSNVLFVKNLSPKVTEEDLASLFINFQQDDDHRIVFKLCTGRMKGQAFVTFRDVETATAALELVHGYDFKGKPVVVQYGRNPA